MELRKSSIFNNLIFWLSLIIFLSVVAGFNFALVKLIKHFWNYDSTNPGFQLSQQIEIGTQLFNVPLYIIWLFVSLFYFQDFVACGFGILGQIVISIIVIAQGSDLQNISLNVLNYNYTIGLPKSHQIARLMQIGNMNSKIGRRFEYWRGYGRF